MKITLGQVGVITMIVAMVILLIMTAILVWSTI